MSRSISDIDFQLPPLENQPDLFKNQYFKQELLPYIEGRDRKVYILNLLYFLIIN